MRLKSILAASFAATSRAHRLLGRQRRSRSSRTPEFADVEALNELLSPTVSTAPPNSRRLTCRHRRAANSKTRDRTLKVLEDVGEGIEFDYDTLTITAQADNGSWGYRYDADTVDQIADADIGDGSIVVTEVWDNADTGTNNAY